MNIGFDAKRAFLNGSGLGNYGRNTLLALQDFYPENRYVLFTPTIRSSWFYNLKGFEVITPGYPASACFKSLWRSFLMSKSIKHAKLDIFHGLSNELPVWIGKTKIPSVVTIHDLIFLHFPQFYKPADRLIYYRKVKYACEKATRIIAISHQTKNDLIHYMQIDPLKIEVVYQAVAPLFFEAESSEHLRQKYHLPAKFILSVGTMEPRKNQLAILEALNRIDNKLCIVFVGKTGDYTKRMMSFMSKNRMEKQVKFLQDISAHDLAGLYKMALFSVYISESEGFGLPVIESMASGCPVIASDKSVLPETAGGAALLCNPADLDMLCMSTELLLNNESMRKELITKGLEHAKHFRNDRFAEKMISLYKALISN